MEFKLKGFYYGNLEKQNKVAHTGRMKLSVDRGGLTKSKARSAGRRATSTRVIHTGIQGTKNRETKSARAAGSQGGQDENKPTTGGCWGSSYQGFDG